MRLLKDISPKSVVGKTCLVRVDFNVESEEDALRLEASLPTLKWLLANGNRIVVLSHRGRPNLTNDQRPTTNNREQLSLRGFVPFLEKNLGEKVLFLSEIPDSLSEGKVFLLENLRFWPGEEKDDPEFAARLAKLGDFYVNDAFAVCHRANSSVTQLPKLLPGYAGFLLEKEVQVLGEAMKSPKASLVLIFGGAKVSDKLPVVENLLLKTEKVLLGSSILNSKEPVPDSEKIVRPADWVGEGLALDIGPMTIESFKKEIAKAATIIWNGPLGKFEDPKYMKGSEEIAKAIVASGAFSIIGGGETTTLFQRVITNYQLLITNRQIFLSTGGGAMLEFLSGKELPGIAALV